jgi:hypothetical protein
MQIRSFSYIYYNFYDMRTVLGACLVILIITVDIYISKHNILCLNVVP